MRLFVLTGFMGLLRIKQADSACDIIIKYLVLRVEGGVKLDAGGRLFGCYPSDSLSQPVRSSSQPTDKSES
jgi:hypothetical protein